VGDDGRARCPWAAGDPALAAYHDTEWGVPVRGERALFERLSLEAFQSGLSWRTILAKRPGFRAAFADFDPEVVAAFGDDDVDRLLADAGIVRHRAKIEATRTNARATVALREHGGLETLVAAFRPPPGSAPRTVADLASRTDASLALSTALRARGFTFVGPTTMHALQQALGYVDDHLVGCHRRGAAAAVGAPLT
jgi:DNA-3-methyladenine glycosylase I